MTELTFPQTFTHDHPPVEDVYELYVRERKFGEKAADWIAAQMGSWRFIIAQTIILVFWIILNTIAWIQHWDPYPFILMNLVLSTQAAFAAPIIMMSQGRQAAKDRLEAHHDYAVNQKSEIEIRVILEHLEAQNIALQTLHDLLLSQQAQIGGITSGKSEDKRG